MSNDIFVIANMAADSDSSSAAGKTDHERMASLVLASAESDFIGNTSQTR